MSLCVAGLGGEIIITKYQSIIVLVSGQEGFRHHNEDETDPEAAGEETCVLTLCGH